MQKRDVWIILLCVIAALALGAAQLGGTALETGAWGLSFRTEGQPPTAPASRETLKKYDAAYIGNTNEKKIYLTFDAGYENGCTAQILDILKERNVPACFFLVGNYIEKNADLVRRMAAEGHTVANHTMHHYEMDKISDPAAFQKELTDLENLYREVTGGELAKYYRPPRGIYSEENLKNAQKAGYRTVFWSLAYVDWLDDKQPSEEQAFGKLLPRIHNGAVLLLHSTSRTNAAILDRLITEYEGMGYTFAPINELFEN